MPETHGVSSWRGPGDAPEGKTKAPEWVLPASGEVQSMKRSTAFSWSEQVIKIGANDELPDKVAKVRCNSEYWSCPADLAPVGELEHGGECDLGVHISDSEGGELAEDFQNGETSREETRDDKHEAKGDYQSIKGNYRGWGLRWASQRGC